MKPIRRRPQVLEKTGSELEGRVAKYAAELKRVSRSLRILSAFNRVMENAAHDLLHAIQRANAHSGATASPNKELGELRARYHTLTPRERDVMELVVEGLLNKEIASELGTAQITVKIQRGNVMKKMKAASVADLVRMSEKLKARNAS